MVAIFIFAKLMSTIKLGKRRTKITTSLSPTSFAFYIIAIFTVTFRGRLSTTTTGFPVATILKKYFCTGMYVTCKIQYILQVTCMSMLHIMQLQVKSIQHVE